MRKIMFYVNGDKELQTYEDDVSEKEINEDFNEWIMGRGGWYDATATEIAEEE